MEHGRFDSREALQQCTPILLECQREILTMRWLIKVSVIYTNPV